MPTPRFVSSAGYRSPHAMPPAAAPAAAVTASVREPTPAAQPLDVSIEAAEQRDREWADQLDQFDALLGALEARVRAPHLQ